MGISSCFEIDENTDNPKYNKRPNKKEEEPKNEGNKKSNKETISENSSKKLYNSIVRVKVELNEKESISGTGFFLKLKLNDKTRNYLITCNDAINEKFIKEKKVIKLYYGKINEEKYIEIKLDKNKRDIKCLKNPLNLTLIEILKEDKITEDNFLLPDMSYKKEGYINYINKSKNFYLVGYTKNNEIQISSGKITEILEKPKFKHSMNNADYNSEALICSEDNLLVVGIHKKGDNSKKINNGIFLGYILDNLENITSLENIKSKDIIKKTFYYLDESIKLKVIKYNNQMQNLNDININNYKFFTHKYIEYETNIKGKEFDGNNGILFFEGEYLNGERNGYGKEYNYKGKLEFEGEYLNGKRNGNGKGMFSIIKFLQSPLTKISLRRQACA